LKAYVELYAAWSDEPGWRAPNAAECRVDTDALLKLRGTVPTEPGNPLILDAKTTVLVMLTSAPGCFLANNDCVGAVKAYGDLRRAQGYTGDDAGLKNELFGDMSQYTHREMAVCKGKVP
jgi:hypothetical protein